jgi:putative ABC transport system substrate-binding protein
MEKRRIAEGHPASSSADLGVALLGLLLVLSGSAGPARAGDVAVLMGAEVGAYDEALEGFEKALNPAHRIVAEFNMNGDFDRGAEFLRKVEAEKKPDLIFAVGVWALQTVVKNPTRLPVVYAMVLNPPSVLGMSLPNVTGASMNVPAKETLGRLKQLGPKIRRVGLVFSQPNTGYLVTEATAAARDEGIELVSKQVSQPGDVVPALEALHREGIDAFWILPDETVLVPAVTQHVFLYAYRNKIPVIGLSERQAEMGAVLALSVANNQEIGSQAAELATAILEGGSPSRLPYTRVRDVHLTVNLKVARKIGVAVPDSLRTSADTVIE